MKWAQREQDKLNIFSSKSVLMASKLALAAAAAPPGQPLEGWLCPSHGGTKVFEPLLPKLGAHQAVDEAVAWISKENYA